MAVSELEQDILDLHAQDLSPRHIAQFLGVSLAQVHHILRAHGLEQVLTLPPLGDLPPVYQCLVSRACGDYLLQNQNRDEMPISSLGLVTITRLKGYNHFWVCTYLIDYLCLGLKDTLGPRAIERDRYNYFLETSYQAFPGGYSEISLAQAQALVFGAVEYAAKAGFEANSDFEQTVYHLGHWSGQPQLEFGYQGQPFYINGPYDDARQVIKSLETHVGRGKFKYILGIG
ncbi:MAG: helix-turn-helix domain-containing protein [Spirulina sp. SIO3F2]|nr:helix-turn-helix domain-containing protein [Spirulina sp. SIO3F2]